MNTLLIDFIQNEIIGGSGEVTVENDDDLLGSGLVDSLGMMRLIRFVEEEFDIKIPPEDMTIENFMTVGQICGYVLSKTEKS